MVRSWVPSFLIPFSFRCFFSKTCAVNLSTLNGKILDAYFSTAIFLLSFLSNSSKNELWMGRCGERGRVHHKYMLYIHSKHPLNILSFHVSKGYSIFRFAQLSWHSTSKNKLWMVDLGFLLFYTFLISFSFHSFLFQNLQV